MWIYCDKKEEENAFFLDASLDKMTEHLATNQWNNWFSKYYQWMLKPLAWGRQAIHAISKFYLQVAKQEMCTCNGEA